MGTSSLVEALVSTRCPFVIGYLGRLMGCTTFCVREISRTNLAANYEVTDIKWYGSLRFFWEKETRKWRSFVCSFFGSLVIQPLTFHILITLSVFPFCKHPLSEGCFCVYFVHTFCPYSQMQVRLHCNQSQEVAVLVASGDLNHQSLYVSCYWDTRCTFI